MNPCNPHEMEEILNDLSEVERESLCELCLDYVRGLEWNNPWSRVNLREKYGRQQGDAIWTMFQAFQSEMKEMQKTFQSQTDMMQKELEIQSQERLKEAERKLLDDVKKKYVPFVSMIIIIILSGVIFFFLNEAKDVNNAVIKLQSDILSAQTVIEESRDKMLAAQEELKQIQSDYQNAIKHYETLTKELDEAKTKYERARIYYEEQRKDLEDAKVEYERLSTDLQDLLNAVDENVHTP